jgi:hypothetical protein
MNWQNAALAMAGVIGSAVAVVHGILVQRLMVKPFEEFFLTDKRIAASVRGWCGTPAFQHSQLVPRWTGPDRRHLV